MSHQFDQTDVIQSGYLQRKGLVLGRWKQRYFILRDTFMFVVDSEPPSFDLAIAHPSHVIALNSIGVDCRECGGDKSHPFMFIISIKSPKEEHVFSASSSDERQEWIDCINSSIKLFTESLEDATNAAQMTASSTQQRASSRPTSRGNSRSVSRTASPSHSREPSSLAARLPRPTLPRAASLAPSASASPLRAADDTDFDADPVITSQSLHHSVSSPLRLSKEPSSRRQLSTTLNLDGAGSTMSPQQAPRVSGALSLQPSDGVSARSRVAALAGAASDQVGLDAFTLRTRNSILDGEDAEDENGGFGSNFQEPNQQQQLYDDDETTTPSTVSSGLSISTTAIGTSSASARRSVDRNVPLSPRSPAPDSSESAVDEETRLKLKMIEESQNDPELLALLHEQQTLSDKIAKLKLHKKVLTNELKSVLPKLGIQQKVNASFQEEINFHKQLKSKRTAHRIQVGNWALNMKMRLARSEPGAFLKHLRNQNQLQQQQTAAFSSPAFKANHNNQYGVPGSSSSSSGRSVSPNGISPSPFGLSPSSKSVHQELVRMSNAELDALEMEIKARRPDSGPNPLLLTMLEKEELQYVDADANRPPSLQQLEHQALQAEWNQQQQQPNQKSHSSPEAIVAGASSTSAGTNGSKSSTHDPHYLILRAHAASLNDYTQVIINILLREVSIRRQLNLLQASIFRLTADKETMFQKRYAMHAAMAAAAANKKGSKKEKKQKKDKKDAKNHSINPSEPVQAHSSYMNPSMYMA